MAVQSTPTDLSPGSILSSTLLNPIITGPLLLYLRKNPSLLARLPWPPTRTYVLPDTLTALLPFSTIRVGATEPLKLLKYLFTWGLILSTNRLLSRLALNYWHLKKQGAPWDFATEGKEVILITGGCSGFGKEMVKLFAERTKARIIVLDVNELPEELKGGMLSISFQTRTALANSGPPQSRV
jgi:all-trans-retinol dehydrogenase (NAD+)